MNLNKALLIGRITRDPELKALPTGMSVCTLSIATNEVFKNKDGEKQESTDFHSIAIFGKLAENTARYMKKGNEIYIEGKIKTRSWEQDGVKRYKTEIVASNVQFGSKQTDQSESVARETPKSDKGNEIEYPADEIDPSDIPF